MTLSYRRQQSPGGVTRGSWRVGYNQVVGAVFIKRDVNIELNDQTNREGILEGPAYFDLRAFALEAIHFFETKRVEYERSKKKDTELETRQNDASKAVQESSVAVNELEKAADKLKNLMESADLPGDPEVVEKISTGFFRGGRQY